MIVFLIGFTIFSVLGNLANELNVPIETVIKSGQGLAFISYPTAIAKFDYVPQVAKHFILNFLYKDKIILVINAYVNFLVFQLLTKMCADIKKSWMIVASEICL